MGDFVNQLEVIRLVEKRLSYMRLEKSKVVMDVNLPNRQEALRQMDSYINITLNQLDSLNRSIASIQLEPSEEPVIDKAAIIEKLVTQKDDSELIPSYSIEAEQEEEDEFELMIPSYFFEEGDDSLNLDLLIPSFLFDEKENSSYKAKFQSKEVSSSAVNWEKLECLKELVFNHSKIGKSRFSLLFDASRSIFDRGKRIPNSFNSNKKLIVPWISSSGYQLDFSGIHLTVHLCINEAEILDASILFDKMSESLKLSGVGVEFCWQLKMDSVFDRGKIIELILGSLYLAGIIRTAYQWVDQLTESTGVLLLLLARVVSFHRTYKWYAPVLSRKGAETFFLQLDELLEVSSTVLIDDYSLLALGSVRRMFDRGKRFHLPQCFSGFVGVSEFNIIITTSGFCVFTICSILLAEYPAIYAPEILLEYGYRLHSWLMHSFVVMLFTNGMLTKGGVCITAGQVFGKMIQMDIVCLMGKHVLSHQVDCDKSSYSCVHLTGSVFDRGKYIVVQPDYFGKLVILLGLKSDYGDSILPLCVHDAVIHVDGELQPQHGNVSYTIRRDASVFIVMHSAHRIYDRGKWYFNFADAYSLAFDTHSSGVIILIEWIFVDVCSVTLIYILIAELGYWLELLIDHSNSSLFVNTGVSSVVGQLFDRRPQQRRILWTILILQVQRQSASGNAYKLCDHLLDGFSFYFYRVGEITLWHGKVLSLPWEDDSFNNVNFRVKDVVLGFIRINCVHMSEVFIMCSILPADYNTNSAHEVIFESGYRLNSWVMSSFVMVLATYGDIDHGGICFYGYMRWKFRLGPPGVGRRSSEDNIRDHGLTYWTCSHDSENIGIYILVISGHNVQQLHVFKLGDDGCLLGMDMTYFKVLPGHLQAVG